MKLIRFLFASCILLVFSTGVASSKDNIDYELTADYFSKYIWRGQNLDDDPVFQPSINASYESLTATIRGNLELTNINGNSGDFSEVDYSLDYSGKLSGIEGIGYSAGVIYYDFPGTETKDTTEVYGGLNLDFPLNPSVTVYRDIDEAEGSYISLGACHSIEKLIEISPGIPLGLDIGISLGWGSSSYNKYYWGTDQSKLNNLAFSVSFPFEIDGWSLVPSLNYVTLPSDDIRDTDAYGTDSDFFFAGISLFKSF
jgi:hypothetical protein